MRKRLPWTRAPIGALALFALLAAGGCGESKERRAVNAYVDRVDAIMRGEQRDLRQAQLALDSFASTTPREQAALRKTIATCERLLRRVERLDAPPEAAGVQRRLRAFLAADRDAAVAAADLNAFLAAEKRPQARLHTAETRLQSALRRAKGAQAQQRAFATFAAAVEDVHRDVTRLPAHGVAAGWRRAEAARLARLRAAADGVATAVAGQDATAMRTGLARVQTEIRGEETIAAERHAVALYRRIARRVTRASVALGKARSELRRRFA